MISEEVKEADQFNDIKAQSKIFGDFQKSFLEKQCLNNTSTQNEILVSTFRKNNSGKTHNNLSKRNTLHRSLEGFKNDSLNPNEKLIIPQIINEEPQTIINEKPNEQINNEICEKPTTSNNGWVNQTNIILKVKTFAKKLKNASSLRALVLTKNQKFIKLLSDKIFYNENSIEKKSFIKKFHSMIIQKVIVNKCLEKLFRFQIFKKIESFLKSRHFVFHPYSNIKIFWDTIQLFLIIFWLFLIPLSIAFEEVNFFEERISYDSMLLLLLNIIVAINTSFFNDGILEEKRGKILVNYLKHDFIIDIFGVLPFFLNGVAFHLKFFRSLFFIKILKIQEILDRILEKLLLKEKLQQIMRLFKVFFISLFVAHIFACLWYLSTKISDSTDNWLSRIEIDSKPWSTKYLYSIYWAFVTMMTVGYGDITPRNEIEIVICLIALVLGCVVYAYNINSVGMILQDINKEQSDFQHKINIINNFMNKKNVSADLQRRIREYLRFIWIEENLRYSDEEHKIIQVLSNSLREELLLQSYDSIIKKTSMFYANFTEKTLRKTVAIIKDIKLFPDEIIFTENEEDNNSIYFIKKGKIELFTGNDHVIKELGADEYFGEISFFTGNRRVLSARSKDFTTLYAINREDFINILRSYSDDYEKFCMIKDQITLYGDYSSLRSFCFSCNAKDHLVKECPLNHFVPDKEKIVKKNNFYLDNERENNFCRVHMKYNALINRRKIAFARKKFKSELKKNKNILITSKQALQDMSNYENSSSTFNNNNLNNNSNKDYEDDLQNNSQESHELDEKITIEMKPKIKNDFTFSSLENIPTNKYEDFQQNEISKSKDDKMKEKPIISLKFLDANENKSSNNLLNSPRSNVNLESNKNIESVKIKSNANLKTSHKELIRNISTNTEEKIEKNTAPGNTRQESGALHMDSLKKFKIYFPKGNADFIIEMIQESKKSNDINKNNITRLRERDRKLDFQLSKYTFFTGKMKSIMQGQKKMEQQEEVCNRENKNFPFKMKKRNNFLRKGLSMFWKKSGE